ncbi:MAG: tRNA threonylcarbamoyladenosine dehydratase [Prevotellaceae bacterium]|jgi:tRNA A37 threonylcarbamoyladenosine dehydratase|nr:tRNA threonylcarbamoyladenosine dehydratase [Prevotellaceae bacterium]
MNSPEAPWMERTLRLLGEEKMERITQAHILVVGLGGVGAYAAELLVRAGVGRLTLVDADVVQPSNLNRQLPALCSTLGRGKAEVMAERLLDINPGLQLTVHPVFLEEAGIPALLEAADYSFVVDAIDTIAPKCALIAEALQRKLPIISSMGAGAKSDVTRVRFADLGQTYHCPLSKAVRQRLKKRGIRRPLPVVFSTEQADRRAIIPTPGERNKHSTCGTISYLPAVFGCYLADYVLRKLH